MANGVVSHYVFIEKYRGISAIVGSRWQFHPSKGIFVEWFCEDGLLPLDF